MTTTIAYQQWKRKLLSSIIDAPDTDACIKIMRTAIYELSKPQSLHTAVSTAYTGKTVGDDAEPDNGDLNVS